MRLLCSLSWRCHLAGQKHKGKTKKPAHSLQRQETNWGLCLQPGAGRTGLSECETTLT